MVFDINMDITTIPRKSLIKMGKMVGVSFSYDQIENQEIESILKLRGKYEDFMAILDFLNLTCRSNINHFIFKVKKIIGNHIKSKEYYQEVDIDDVVSKIKIIKESTEGKYNHVRSYCIGPNEGKRFLSIDIRTANFTVLKKISGGEILETAWSDYFRKLVPNDIRTNRKRNIENNVAGIPFDIPSCIYESKFLRQFILGDLKKLRFLWELMNLQLLSKFVDLGIKNNVCVNSDEIIIEVSDYCEADNIVKLLSPDPNVFRVKKFTLIKIGDKKNYMLKLYSDGTKILCNVNPSDYPDLYRKYI